jgi:phage baseplate assembly protein gpV
MTFQATNDFVDAVEDYSNAYYVGTVVSISDPLKLDRVQANVPGLYDPTQGPVPWIAPLKDSPFGFGTGSKGPYGTYGCPPVGSIIKVELQNGDPHKPLYTNLYTLPNVNPAFPTTVWGFQDPDGNIVQYDLANHTYRFVTSGGAVITIDASGKRVTAVSGDTTNSNGNWQVNVTGNAGIQASGNITLQAGGTATYTATSHQFNGPVNASSTISAGGDITDNTDSGNGQTMADMRTIYNEHYHVYDDNGSSRDTDPPTPQIP